METVWNPSVLGQNLIIVNSIHIGLYPVFPYTEFLQYKVSKKSHGIPMRRIILLYFI